MNLTDRKSRYEITVKIKNYHANTCRKTLQEVIDDYSPQFFKTVTFDNGSELADLSKVPGTTVYLSHQNSPWGRQSNVKQNGLIQEFIPNGKSMCSLNLINIQSVQNALNQCPRKILNCQSSMD